MKKVRKKQTKCIKNITLRTCVKGTPLSVDSVAAEGAGAVASAGAGAGDGVGSAGGGMR